MRGRTKHIGGPKSYQSHAGDKHDMERGPDRHIDAIEGVPVSIQWEGDSSRKGREAYHIRTKWGREELCERNAVLGHARIAPCPPTLDQYVEQGRDATEGDSAQHHNMWWDECAIPSDKRVPLNIPARTFEKNDGAKQRHQP